MLLAAAAVCGIFGYYNYHVPRTRKQILDCLLTGLRRLEYRGYDSSGVCIDAQPAVAPATPLRGGAAPAAPAAAATNGDVAIAVANGVDGDQGEARRLPPRCRALSSR